MKIKSILLCLLTVLTSCANKQVTPPKKPLFLFLGSSVTLGSATGGISFVDIIPSRINCEVKKLAVSGTTLTDNGYDETCYIRRLKNDVDSKEKVEHLIVQLSTNDVTKLKKIGDVSTSSNIDDFDVRTIIGAIEYIIGYAKQTFNCDVSFYTNPKYNNSLYEEVITKLYDVQDKWKIGIIDFYNYVNIELIDDITLSSYMSDAIHPNANGYIWMCDIVSNYLKQAYEEKYPGYSIEINS